MPNPSLTETGISRTHSVTQTPQPLGEILIKLTPEIEPWWVRLTQWPVPVCRCKKSEEGADTGNICRARYPWRFLLSCTGCLTAWPTILWPTFVFHAYNGRISWLGFSCLLRESCFGLQFGMWALERQDCGMIHELVWRMLLKKANVSWTTQCVCGAN